MAALAVQTVSLAGVTPAYVAGAEAGDTFYNDGRTFLHVKNGNGAASRTVTINSLVNCSQGHDHDIAVVVPLSSEKMIGPFPTSRFNNSSNVASVTYSDEADLTIAAIKLE